MLNLLDAAIEATVSRGNPVIVSENHNLDTINWIGGMSDPGEMVGCGMYQQLRRLAGESDTDYQQRVSAELKLIPPEHAEKINNAMKDSAVKRFGVSTVDGKISLMVAGESAWSGLGVHIESATDSRNAIILSNLNKKVLKVPMKFTIPSGPRAGETIESTDTYAILCEATGNHFGTVGKNYKIIQNDDSFKFLDSVIGEFGAKFETAGAIYGGQKVWMQVHLPKQSFTVKGSDRVEAYAMFQNSHDGLTAAKCYPTSKRVVCQNTFRQAQSDKDKGISIRHTGNLDGKIESAKQALGLAVDRFTEFANNAEVLVNTPVAPIPYFQGVLDSVLEITEADVTKGASLLAAALAQTNVEIDRDKAERSFALQIKKRGNMLDELLERYESKTQGVDGIRGSGWSSFNAVTESVNYGLLGGVQRKDAEATDRRFESIISGNGDDTMQVAYQQILEKVRG